MRNGPLEMASLIPRRTVATPSACAAQEFVPRGDHIRGGLTMLTRLFQAAVERNGFCAPRGSPFADRAHRHALSLPAVAVFAIMGLVVAGGPSRTLAEPLTISKNCTLLRDGRPYRGIGVNYFDGFLRFLVNPEDASYRLQFARLQTAGIPFVRFALMPYWPNEARPFVQYPDRLFAAFDRFVADAEAHHIGLIPSVFFNFATVPDVMGEPVSAWADRDSKTAKFARTFSQKLAARYAGSSAIWAWELSNETDSWSDFPDGYRYLAVEEAEGTPASRSIRDNYTSAQMSSALAAFRDAIRSGDPTRLVEGGYGLPRNNAYHLAQGGSAVNSLDEFNEILVEANKSADLISLHVYPSSLSDPDTTRTRRRPGDRGEVPCSRRSRRASGLQADIPRRVRHT